MASTANEIHAEAMASIMADEATTKRFISDRINDALPLIVKAEWDMEDNFTTTEGLVEAVGAHVEIDNDAAAVIAEFYDVDYDNLEEFGN